MDVYDLLTLAMSCKNVFYRLFLIPFPTGIETALSVGVPQNFLSYFPIHREMFTGTYRLRDEWGVMSPPPALGASDAPVCLYDHCLFAYN
jgi:hypothetical protein